MIKNKKIFFGWLLVLVIVHGTGSVSPAYAQLPEDSCSGAQALATFNFEIQGSFFIFSGTVPASLILYSDGKYCLLVDGDKKLEDYINLELIPPDAPPAPPAPLPGGNQNQNNKQKIKADCIKALTGYLIKAWLNHLKRRLTSLLTSIFNSESTGSQQPEGCTGASFCAEKWDRN